MKPKLLLTLFLTYLIICLLWTALVAYLHVSPRIIPSPLAIIQKYIQMISGTSMWQHTLTTLEEVGCGFIIGSMLALILGYTTGKIKILEKVLSPLIISLHLVPKLALAPLFFIWFGFGSLPKIIISALVVFFPVYINVLLAIKSIDSNWQELFTLYRSTSWQKFYMLEVPSSLPLVFAGFKTGITMAIIGAIVGEFIGANKGLGFLITLGMVNLETDLVFAVILQLIIIGVVLYNGISLLGSYLNRWHESEKQEIIK